MSATLVNPATFPFGIPRFHDAAMPRPTNPLGVFQGGQVGRMVL